MLRAHARFVYAQSINGSLSFNVFSILVKPAAIAPDDRRDSSNNNTGAFHNNTVQIFTSCATQH